MQGPDSVRRDFVYAITAFLTAVILVGGGVAAAVRAVRPELPAGREVTVGPSSTAAPAVSPRARAIATPRTVARPSPLTAQMTTLVAGLPPGSVSVAARNLTTGAGLTFGTSGGQTAASLVKVDILEALLLLQQRSGGGLPGDQNLEAIRMIETSDDDAAGDLWNDIGAGPGLAAANQRLGVRCTVPGPGPDWGLTTTCAQGQIQLLYQLENRASPLNPPSRGYILNLMENVSPSQAWGIPMVADSSTRFAVKNGWLNLNGDSDWAVNSDAIVRYHGQTLLIAVLTQNNNTVYSGVALVQQLAQVTVRSVAS